MPLGSIFDSPLTQQAASQLAPAIVVWQRAHGRNTLPWQGASPYQVWLSEVMLQQTQVATVLRYYLVFLQRFPDVFTLAAAPVGAVLAVWSGLGYYSRARNLQRAAQMVVANYDGIFPTSAQELVTLPGVGRSSANAIAAFCYQERVAILDANVRRVLARVFAFGGDLSLSREVRTLWGLARSCLPQAPADMPAYTQGLMDLGARVCRTQQPACQQCPLRAQCAAYAQDSVQDYPKKKRRIEKKKQVWWLLWLQDAQGKVYLEQRPQGGIWGGLSVFPSFAQRSELEAAAIALGVGIQEWKTAQALPPVQHTLTHRVLHLHPVRLVSEKPLSTTLADRWFTLDSALALGLPAPIRKYLKT